MSITGWIIFGFVLILSLAAAAYLIGRFVSKPEPGENRVKSATTPESGEKKATKARETSGSAWKTKLGWGLGIVLVMWIGFSAYQHFSPSDKSQSSTPIGLATGSLDNVPWSVAKLYISGCESGIDGKPGTGRQFDDKKNLVRNPDKPDVVGKYQINLTDHTVATAVLENGWDVYTEEGNEKAAEYLYSQDKFGPWEDTRGCWGSQLAVLGYGIEITTAATYVAPVGKFSDEVLIPAGIFFSWGDSEGSFVIRDQKGAEARYDPNNSIVENLPYPNKKIAFKSLGGKPAIVKLKFSKVPFR